MTQSGKILALLGAAAIAAAAWFGWVQQKALAADAAQLTRSERRAQELQAQVERLKAQPATNPSAP